MLRIFAIVGLAFVGLGAAVAGPISSGTLVPINLTTSNVYIGTCSSSPGCTPTVSGTNVGGTFETQLFTGLITSAPPPSPSSISQNVTTGSGTIPFILAAQSGSPFDDTYLTGNSTNQDTSLVVDLGSCTGLGASSTCGLFNVDDVYTMIQATGGAYGFQGITVTLNGVTPGDVAVTDTINLTAGVDYRGTNSSTALPSCTDANSNNPTKSVGTACTAQSSDAAQVSGTDSSPGGSGGNTVVTYNNVFGTETKSGTNYYLDVQELALGTHFAGDYLNSITITSDSPSGGKERMLFSGLTVDEAPEPGTSALLGIGLGLAAFWKIRGRRAKNGSPAN